MSDTAGHTAPVSCAAATRDGCSLASGGYDRRILLWDAARGTVLRELRGHTGLVNALDFSRDGTLVASASSDHSARLWDAATGRERARLLGHADDVNDVRVSPDGARIATASFDGTVRVFTRSGACLLVAAHHRSDVNGVAWFPDGKRLAAASDDGTVSIFDADGGRVRRVLAGHRDWVDHVAVHPSGALVASASLDGTVGVFAADSGARLATLDGARCVVKDVAFSPDGAELAASSYDGRVRVYETSGWRLVADRFAERLWNRTLAWTPGGWLTGSFGGGPVVLGPDGARFLGRATTPGLNGFALAPGGARAAACSDDGSLYEFDLERGAVARVLARHDAAVLCAAYSADGSLVASGSWDRTVRVSRVADGEPVALLRGLDEPINALCFEAHGTRLWLGMFNGEVLLWDPAAPGVESRGAHEGSVKGLARAGERVVSVGRDGHVRVFAASRESAFRAGESILNGVALAHKGERIATVSRRNGVELWSADGERVAQFRGHPCSAKTVAFAPDESLVAAGYYDGAVALFDPASGMARVDAFADTSVSQVAFRGRELLVSTWDAAGTLARVDPQRGLVASISVAA